MTPKLSMGDTVVASWRLYRRQWRFVNGVALIVFAPISLLSLLELDADSRQATFVILGILVAAIVQYAISTLGDQFYEAVVEGAAAAHRYAHRQPSAWAVFRNLPYARLIGADVLLTVMIFVGLVLLVVPGILVIVWFALVAPLIKIEHLTIKAAMRRSVELVKGNAFRVGTVVLATMAAAGAIEYGIEHAFELLHWGLGGEYLGTLVGAVVAEPLVAVPIVVMTFMLLELHAAAPEEHAAPDRATPGT